MSSISSIGSYGNSDQLSYIQSLLSRNQSNASTTTASATATDDSSSTDSSSTAATGFTGFESLLSSILMGALLTPQAAQTGGNPPTAKDMFASMDTNSDGAVTEEEFVTARPDDVSEADSESLFASIDTSSTGSITEAQLEASLTANAPTTAADETSTASAELFNTMDTNGDGVLSESEFVTARPDEVSADQAKTLYASLDTNGTGITEAQFSDFESGKTSSDTTVASSGGGGGTQSFEALDTNKDGTVSQTEYLAGHPELEASSSTDTSSSVFADSSTSSDTGLSQGDTLLAQLLDAIKAYAQTNYSTVNKESMSSTLLTA